MASIDSLDNLINASNLDGTYPAFYAMSITTTTAANATSGYVTAQMATRFISVPTLGGSVTKAYLTYFRATSENSVSALACYKLVDMGNINMNTGTFTDGSTMGTATINGTSVTLASTHLFATVTSAVTATTPTVTITYTDQDGNTGNSCALTLPTSPAALTTFVCNPHMANGDTGARDITNITKSAGTAGTITIYGGLELGRGMVTASTGNFVWEPILGVGRPVYPLSGGDKIGFVLYGTTSATDLYAFISLVPER